MTAYYLCEQKNVMLITKSKLDKSNSSLAQGGIATQLYLKMTTGKIIFKIRLLQGEIIM
ncbi:hypothetical protein KHA80_04730 [Anaerobacillus sp. HL2]|nr:hypothetical protein KHA80_04730 [Anaerobacillus sp. HL2]